MLPGTLVSLLTPLSKPPCLAWSPGSGQAVGCVVEGLWAWGRMGERAEAPGSQGRIKQKQFGSGGR